jgi:hypothetical protein
LKASEKAKQIQQRIATRKLLSRGPALTNKEKKQYAHEIAKLERELQTLPKQHKVKRTYKKLTPEKIRAYVLQTIETAKSNGVNWITAEDIAHQLQVKPHAVKQVLQQLNIDGVLHQPHHHIPHDSNREPYGFGGYSGWAADIYYFRQEEEGDEE